MTMLNWKTVLAPILALTLSTSGAVAEDYPSRPIKLIVSAPVGGGVDIVARLLASKLQDKLKQSIIVEPHPAGAGNVAVELVEHAKPDGYTFLVTFDSYIVNAVKRKKTKQSVVTDLTPVTQVVESGSVLLVPAKLGVDSLKQFVTWAKGYKGNLNAGAPGADSLGSVAAKGLISKLALNAELINNKGSAGTLTGLLSGTYQFGFSGMQASLPMIHSGDLKAIGVTTPKRSVALPDVPSISEEVPGFTFASWYGVFGPPKLPPKIASEIQGDISSVLQLADVKDVIVRDAATPVGSTPADFKSFLVSNFQSYQDALATSPAAAK